MSNRYPCRVSGCAGDDSSRIMLCERHFKMLPRDIRTSLALAINNSRVLPSTQRGRVLAPAVEKALSWIEANENAVSLFGDDL